MTTTRDDISVRNGESVTGITLTITEGAALIRGRVSGGESEALPMSIRVYLVPAGVGASASVYRFYETDLETDGAFVLDNVAPGKYWIVARPAEKNEAGVKKSIRQDETLRAKVFSGAEAFKRAVTLKPCEKVADFVLRYSPSPP